MRCLYTTTSEALGLGSVVFAWRSDNERLAAAGHKRIVTIYDRNGQAAAQINLPDSDFEYDESLGAVQTLAWHPSGSHLAILPRGQTFAMVYDAASGGVARVDGGVKQEEVCFVCWCPGRPLLALGTVRGTALAYDCATRTLGPLAARHAKPICCGAWSGSDVIALGSWDASLSLCRAADGRLAKSISLRGRPAEVAFCRGAVDGAALYLSVAAGRRALYVWEVPLALVSDAVPPLELSFPPELHGDLECHAWVGDGLLAAGFSSGQVVVVALGARGGAAAGLGPGSELFSARVLAQPVAALAWNPAAELLAAGGGAGVAVLHCPSGAAAGSGGIQLLRSEGMELTGGQAVAGLEWSPSGDLLTVATRSGRLHQYLARAHLLHAACGSRLAYATSLSEVAVQDAGAPRASSVAVRLEAEPMLLALGPEQLAAAREGKVWLHSLRPDQFGLLPAPSVLELPEAASALCLNASTLAVLGAGGRVFVQPLAPGGGPAGPAGELCGEDGAPHEAACLAVTAGHVVVGLPGGRLCFYRCADLELAGEYAHTEAAGGGGARPASPAGVACAFGSPSDDRVVFQDSRGAAFLFDLPSAALVPLPECAGGPLGGVLWDAADPRLLVAATRAGGLLIYLHVAASVAGHGVKLVGRQAQPPNLVPLVLAGGRATCQTSAGQLSELVLDSHCELVGAEGEADEAGAAPPGGAGRRAVAPAAHPQLLARYQQALALCHFPRALETARRLGDAALLQEVGAAALQLLDVPSALAAYEAAGDVGLVEALRPLEGLADPDLLAGQLIPLLGGDPDRAEQLLLRSSQPAAALELRASLGQWGDALRLARALEPGAVGALSLERARAAEGEGHAEEAAALYEEALGRPEVAADPAATAECRGALARCCVQCGRAEQGVALALAAGEPALLAQCAGLLEGQRLFGQAARLYERCGRPDDAVRLYLRAREFAAADASASRVQGAEVRLLLARAKEDLGQYAAAADAYQAAGDVAAAIRVHLQRLGDAEAAARLAGSNPEGLRLLAQHCEAAGQHAAAVRHWCAAGDCDRGFALAKQHCCMPAFADWVRGAATAGGCGGADSTSGPGAKGACDLAAEALRAGAWFEVQLDLPAAAEMFALGGQAERAARLLLQAGGDGVAATVALAGRVRDPAVSALVVAHVEAPDGVGPALISLHLAVGQAEQACAVAEARAAQQQEEGNYKAARDELVAAIAALRDAQAPATPGLLSRLALVHSYLLVKGLVRAGDHTGAARMLQRCADEIGRFPRHTVPILTSTVIECHRAGLHGAAQRWAGVLMRPEHAEQVGEAYRRKIEAIAKRPAWGEADPPEPQCDCLFCGAPGPECALTCAACSRALPFCLATGRRVVLSDWSECPRCRLPCRGTELARAAAAEGRCPLCEGEVGPHAVRRIWDPISHLRRTAWAGGVPG